MGVYDGWLSNALGTLSIGVNQSNEERKEVQIMRTDDKGQDECDWQERSMRRRLVSNWSTTIKSRVSVVFRIFPYTNSRRTLQYLVHIPHDLSDNGQRIAPRGNEGLMTFRKMCDGTCAVPNVHTVS